jgi:hypothetical protein
VTHAAIQPIQTRYGGHLFRSRLEARWAVFLDQWGLAWSYEAEGYAVAGHGAYLPDFYIPGLHGGVYLEVKPADYAPGKADVALWQAFSAGIGKPLMFCPGPPSPRVYIGTRVNGAGDASWHRYCFAAGPDGPQLFIQPTEDAIAEHSPHQAMRIAREARFEHGETPIRPAIEAETAATIGTLKAALHRAYYYSQDDQADDLHSRLINAEFAGMAIEDMRTTAKGRDA